MANHTNNLHWPLYHIPSEKAGSVHPNVHFVQIKGREALTGPVKWSQCFLRRYVPSQDAWTSSSSGCGCIQEEREGNGEKQEKKNKMSNPILIMFNLALPLPGCGYCSRKSNILQEYTKFEEFWWLSRRSAECLAALKPGQAHSYYLTQSVGLSTNRCKNFIDFNYTGSFTVLTRALKHFPVIRCNKTETGGFCHRFSYSFCLHTVCLAEMERVVVIWWVRRIPHVSKCSPIWWEKAPPQVTYLPIIISIMFKKNY